MQVPLRRLPTRDYPALSDYGLVGDGLSAALVSSDGSVDWWCPARFDAPSVFARLLDRRIGGHFAIAPPVRHRREFSYLEGTNVLHTRFVTSDATVALTTFMPHAEAADGRLEGPRRIVRIVESAGGEIDVTVELMPAFDYARRRSPCRALDGRFATASAGDEHLTLSGTVPLEVDEPEEGSGTPPVAATFRMQDGDRHAFVLDYAEGDAPPPVDDPLGLADSALAQDEAFWRDYATRCTHDGPYRADVVRGILALKLLQYAPTGAFVAAPTCSLPESMGGPRNWDYRYAWLRDGVFIVMALESVGYHDEATRFKEWLAGLARRDAPERLQMLYRVDGSTDLDEYPLDHLEGYRRSVPVRVGNAAAEQHQLDTLGEVLMCFPLADELFEGEHRDENWRAVKSIVDWLCDHWHEADSGIWELRGRRRQYVYSKLMAWGGIEHGLRASENHGLPAPRDRWTATKEDVRDFVLREGYDDDFGSFTQVTDRADADASNLLVPIMGFIDYTDPRVLGTVERTRLDLMDHGLVQRYVVDDELPGSEGAFLVGSFWLAENLARAGDAGAARALIDRALATAGPTGLLAEEADAVTDTPLGNYPQGLSHLGLILAAVALAEGEGEGARGRKGALRTEEDRAPAGRH